ncbi:MAG: hypothetical protein Q7U18_13700 [Methylobacter sp.]|nr:hypothetical protein [Methylobacter sp.]
MSIIFTDENGADHQINSGEDMIKAIGQDNKRLLVFTDEEGEVVGSGYSVAQANRSQPLIKALKDAQPLAKSFGETKTTVKETPKIIFTKNEGDSLTELDRVIRSLQKSTRRRHAG